MNASTEAEILPLLGNLAGVGRDYIRQISNIKRFLERWTMDPNFRAAFETDPEAAIASVGVPLRREEIVPLIDDAEARRLNKALKEGREADYPLSVRRYRGFYREKRSRRRDIRSECEASHPRIAAWRRRQINRCIGELGPAKADALVHAPAAFELAKGCTVGCWFCGVQAPKFDHWWPYSEENGILWRGTLGVMKDILGPCIKQGFLYWATDPLDNPDYERFIVDFHAVTGRCPQTTTAQGAKDIERTRRLLQLSHSLGSEIDRFSILSLGMLKKLHAGFAPEELIRVECVPQNREAADKYRKANAGRAREHAEKRAKEVMPERSSSTIACVSGFLFNMVDRSVQLVTPCNACDRWPLGYWVLAKETFNSPEELRRVVGEMIERNLRTSLHLGDVLRLRSDLAWEADGEAFALRSPWIKITLRPHKEPRLFLEMLAEGGHTAEAIAMRREVVSGVPLEETFLLLEELFQRGLFEEDPLLHANGHALGAVA